MTRHITMNITRERKFDEKWEKPTPFPEGKQKATLTKIQLDEEVQNFKGKPSYIASKFKFTFKNEAGNTCTVKATASLNDKSDLFKLVESILTISGRDFDGMDKDLNQFSNWLNALIGCEFVVNVKNNLYKEVTYSNAKMKEVKPLPKVEYPNPEDYKDSKQEFEFPGFKPKPSDNKTMSQSEVDSAVKTMEQETGFESYPDSEAEEDDSDNIPF